MNEIEFIALVRKNKINIPLKFGVKDREIVKVRLQKMNKEEMNYENE